MTSAWSLRLSAGLLLLALPSVATADPAGEAASHACEDAYVRAQVSRREGRLSDARDALLVCAHDPCAPDLKVDCDRWTVENDQRLPSIVVTVHDGAGGDVEAGRVSVDGREVARATQGRAIELDPGPHDIAASGAWGTTRQRIVLAEGEKRRAVVLAIAVPTPAAGRPTRPLWAVYVAGSVAMLGAGGTVAFGVEGLTARSSSCPSGNCPSESAYSSVKGWYIAADAALGVAVVGVGVATVWYLTHRAPRPASDAFEHVAVWTF